MERGAPCYNSSAASLVINVAPVELYSSILIAALSAITCSIVVLLLSFKSQSTKLNAVLLSCSWVEVVAGTVLAMCSIATIVHRGSCQRHWCFFGVFVIMFEIISTGLHMLLLAVERLFSTILNVLHERYCCPKRLKVYCVVIWFVSFAVTLGATWQNHYFVTLNRTCLLNFVPDIYQTAVLVAFHVLGSFLPCLLYAVIAYKARMQERRIHVTSTLTYESYQAEVSVASSYLILTLGYCILWLPLVVFTVLIHVKPVTVNITMPIILLSVGLLTGSVRMVVICTTNPKVKESFTKALHCSSQN